MFFNDELCFELDGLLNPDKNEEKRINRAMKGEENGYQLPKPIYCPKEQEKTIEHTNKMAKCILNSKVLLNPEISSAISDEELTKKNLQNNKTLDSLIVIASLDKIDGCRISILIYKNQMISIRIFLSADDEMRNKEAIKNFKLFIDELITSGCFKKEDGEIFYTQLKEIEEDEKDFWEN